MAEQIRRFMLTVGKPGTYSGSCIVALGTYVLILLLLSLVTQYIQDISMVVQLRLSLARSSIPPLVNYHH